MVTSYDFRNMLGFTHMYFSKMTKRLRHSQIALILIARFERRTFCSTLAFQRSSSRHTVDYCCTNVILALCSKAIDAP
jgi:hypothetical protein